MLRLSMIVMFVVLIGQFVSGQSISAYSESITITPDEAILNNSQIVNPNVHWIERETEMTSPDTRNKRYKFSEAEYDIQGVLYRELLFSDYEVGDEFESTGRYFREADNRIYESLNDNEYLLYDFNVEHGQDLTIHNPIIGYTASFQVSLENSDPIVLLNGESRKIIDLICEGSDGPFEYWIEGLGSSSGFLGSYLSCLLDRTTSLQCFYHNDELLYRNPAIEECWMPTSSREISQLKELTVYPNPTKGETFIESGIDYDHIKIFSTSGTLVLALQGRQETIDLSILMNGLYFIRVESNNKMVGFGKVLKID